MHSKEMLNERESGHDAVYKKYDSDSRVSTRRNFVKNKNFSLLTYFILIVIRFLLVFFPQYGYIHPDEFFQTSEVITGEVFELEATRTWEFNSTMPLRSYALPFVYLKIPMITLKFVLMMLRGFMGVDLLSTYILLVFPRFIMCIISFVNDYSVYKICRAFNLKYDIRLLALASSGVMLTFGIRTFSNTIEMALSSYLLYLVCDCMILSNTIIYQKDILNEKYNAAENVSERVKYFKMRMSLPHHSYSKCVILSTVCVLGLFNRPTFICFGMPLIFFWMLRGMGTSRTVTFADFNLRMLFFILSGIPTFFIIVVIDSLYYGYLSMAQIYIMDISIYNFLVTPVNFIRYNLDPANTASHGEHPRWLHLFINIPLLYNILGLISLVSFGNMLYHFGRKQYQNLPHTHSFVFVMTTAIFAPTCLLSLFNHQEPRFIIPVTIPIILLHSPKLIVGINLTNYMKESKWNLIKYLSAYINISFSGKFVLKVWYTMNILFTIFFGFIHQGGVVQLTEFMSNLQRTQIPAPTQIHLVTSHIYKIPESQFVIPNSNQYHMDISTGVRYKRARRFFLYEYGSLDTELMFKRMKIVLDAAEMKKSTKNLNYKVFLAIPSTKAFELNRLFYKYRQLINYKQEQTFYPHLSTEAFPDFFTTLHPCEVNTDVDELDSTCTADSLNYLQTDLSTASVLRKLSSIAHQMALVLYQVEIKRKT